MKRTRSNPSLAAAALTLALCSSCASIPPVGQSNNTLPVLAAPEQIRWPAEYQPEKATFVVRNRIEIAASPETIWRELVRAEIWPSWYAGAEGVKVLGHSNGELSANSRFAWSTMGLNFTSRVTEFDPPLRLSWESRKSVIQGYHAWLLVPQAGGMTTVITEESQFGFLAFMQRIFLPSKLRKLHDVWLLELKRRAEA
jgi:uncharacterized protein YndB with AHSA1/START domain